MVNNLCAKLCLLFLNFPIHLSYAIFQFGYKILYHRNHDYIIYMTDLRNQLNAKIKKINF